jgi:hypothetical protein
MPRPGFTVDCLPSSRELGQTKALVQFKATEVDCDHIRPTLLAFRPLALAVRQLNHIWADLGRTILADLC